MRHRYSEQKLGKSDFEVGHGTGHGCHNSTSGKLRGMWPRLAGAGVRYDGYGSWSTRFDMGGGLGPPLAG